MGIQNMGVQNVIRFLEKVSENEGAKSEFNAIGERFEAGSAEGFEAIAALGKRHGFELSIEDLASAEKIMNGMPDGGELPDDELESIAGGAAFSPRVGGLTEPDLQSLYALKLDPGIRGMSY